MPSADLRSHVRLVHFLTLVLAIHSLPVQANQQPQSAPPCNAVTGAPPIETVTPVTKKVACQGGRLLRFDQGGVERYACLNLPAQAMRPQEQSTRKWPLVIYLHASLTTPASLYKEGKDLFELHDTYSLSNDENVKGFILLAPEGRRAKVWPGGNGATQTGFRWDEWHRDPVTNLDAAAIDHFLDETIATGLVDTRRVYVFGWSNGGFMAALYGVWRGDRVAAIGQYASASPWERPPCPVPLPANPHIPLVLIRNLCDRVAPCTETSAWISELTSAGWPFESYNLWNDGSEAPAAQTCAKNCSPAQGVEDHVRWPKGSVLKNRLLPFFKQHMKEK
ncbi:MAG TPA: prolyl oligopeptidase family serine peptidase [Thermoanaerobaculia bacterium]|nr:prolyl oligopeptidase family serine peptidase [Thermoanaerobaculia bacterium]